MQHMESVSVFWIEICCPNSSHAQPWSGIKNSSRLEVGQ